MKLSTQAWAFSSTIIDGINRHPFNQELMNGSLARDKFAFYIEQDSLYLQDFARCQALIAAKIPLQFVRDFLGFAEETFIAEQEIVHQFFKNRDGFVDSGFLSPATLAYTNYLLRTCALEPVEIAIAAVLPCFWIYREVGLNIAKQANKDNPYSRWIEAYASDEFNASVNKAIVIFDALSENTSAAIRQKMIVAFYKSACLEWHFWNDAYHGHIFDKI